MVCGAAISVVAAANYCILDCTQICVFRAATGLPCPGCGLTHAALSLFRGEIMQSLNFHPLLLPYLITIVANTFRRDFRFFNWLRSSWWLWTVTIATVGYYVVRMILYFPHGPYPMVYDQRCYLFLVYRVIRDIL